ncbi:MAG: hypothetical protein DCC67_01635 [Planctomycetota bacterium]|nr:MAG: hypothetical protein DCC67_01635 [Planctomycetota bacterium]
MSENGNQFDPFDPTGMLKGMRDATLENWAKLMTGVVNTDAYAGATGAMLDASLNASAPLRKLMETSMTQSLASCNMPSRDDIVRLAEQLTHIEMRLDDMEAKLDALARSTAGRRKRSESQ